MKGETALVGTGYKNLGENHSGDSAYVFVRAAMSWSQQGKLTASDGEANDYFGRAVSLNNETALVGARENDDNGDHSGSAYVFLWSHADGDSCDDADDCLSRYCVDGVCCNNACDGECEACTEGKTGSANGTCAPIPAGLDPEHECPDPDDASSCGPDGKCDGDGGCRLFAPNTVECEPPSCIGNDVANAASYCDGLGGCPDASTEDCEPYACDAGACMSFCSSDEHCSEDHVCNTLQNTCVPMSVCEGHIIVAADGTPTDCSPYRCTDDGQCVSRCQSTADCVDGYRCDSNGDCVDASTIGADGDSGCGYAIPGRTPGRSSALLLAWLALGWAGRRRRLPPRA